MTPLLAEFVGTALLILLGNGVVANVVLEKNKGQGGGWIVITAGWGFAVFVAVATVAPYSGAHINPAVTFGLAVAGLFPWADVPGYVLAQFAGAFVGTTLVFLAYYRHYEATADGGAKLATFCTAPAIRSPGWNLVTEIVGTFVLVFVVFYLAGAEFMMNDETVPVGLGSIGALPVALLVFGIGLSLGGPTGYAINPARDLGPRIAHAVLPVPSKGGSDWGYSWIPVVGPLVGGGAAAFAMMSFGT